jgi:hypothetical protein
MVGAMTPRAEMALGCTPNATNNSVCSNIKSKPKPHFMQYIFSFKHDQGNAVFYT